MSTNKWIFLLEVWRLVTSLLIAGLLFPPVFVPGSHSFLQLLKKWWYHLLKNKHFFFSGRLLWRVIFFHQTVQLPLFWQRKDDFMKCVINLLPWAAGSKQLGWPLNAWLMALVKVYRDISFLVIYCQCLLPACLVLIGHLMIVWLAALCFPISMLLSTFLRYYFTGFSLS